MSNDTWKLGNYSGDRKSLAFTGPGEFEAYVNTDDLEDWAAVEATTRHMIDTLNQHFPAPTCACGVDGGGHRVGCPEGAGDDTGGVKNIDPSGARVGGCVACGCDIPGCHYAGCSVVADTDMGRMAQALERARSERDDLASEVTHQRSEIDGLREELETARAHEQSSASYITMIPSAELTYEGIGKFMRDAWANDKQLRDALDFILGETKVGDGRISAIANRALAGRAVTAEWLATLDWDGNEPPHA